MPTPLDRLAADAVRLARSRRAAPGATYRLQMHAGFPIREAVKVVPYLHDLGVTHVYTSSLLAARPGSLHGYDVTDHDKLNPELGTEDEFRGWVAALRERGMGLILDVVPNHMCVGGDNAWWNDVLENGPSSAYAGYFDIAWQDHPRERLHGKVLLPVLGESYGTMLESGQLAVELAAGAFALRVYERRIPIDPRTYGLVLTPALDAAKAELPVDAAGVVELRSILTAVSHLPPRSEADPDRVAEGMLEAGVVKRRLAALVENDPDVAKHVAVAVARVNGTVGDPNSFCPLDELLDAQAYRLSFWRVATDEINYRRFFDVNDLAALSTEREEVFEATHKKVFAWLGEGLIDGVRVDHPDGLFDPKQYLHRLQVRYLVACAEHLLAAKPDDYPGLTAAEALVAVRERVEPLAGEKPLYVVVEKILGLGEPLPPEWISDGTTGYEFLNFVNGLFVSPAREKDADWGYEQFTGETEPFADHVYHSKFLVLQSSLAGELHMLAHQIDRLAQGQRWSRDFTLNLLRHALREVIACFPVYRTYVNGGVNETDRGVVTRAVRRARVRNPLLGRAVFDFIRDTLLLKDPPSGPASDDYRAAQRRFAGKFQQVTSPVTAKGIEDTAFYVFNRLVSLNEVGGEPGRFGLPPAKVHAFFKDRADRYPAALSPLSTHDTKRSEDVRARINVLAELPEEWAVRVSRWDDLNGDHKVQIDEETVAPDENEEYLLYQTLVGVWPAVGLPADGHQTFVDRIQAYMNKAMHEAKVHTSWINPDAEYDDAMAKFIGHALDPVGGKRFLRDLDEFGTTVSRQGVYNSLAQSLVRCAAPGVPDTYQGTELIDLSLVDPDNRRPVDYDARRRLLADLDARAKDDRKGLAKALAVKPDDRAKLFVVAEALRFRRAHPELFVGGGYEPVEPAGPFAEHLFAFLRTGGDGAALVVVPRLIGTLCPGGRTPVGSYVWADTTLPLPERFAGRAWVSVFTGERFEAGPIAVAELFADFPVALLVAE